MASSATRAADVRDELASEPALNALVVGWATAAAATSISPIANLAPIVGSLTTILALLASNMDQGTEPRDMMSAMRRQTINNRLELLVDVQNLARVPVRANSRVHEVLRRVRV